MSNEVKIQMKGIQKYVDDNHSDTVVNSTKGNYYFRNGAHFVTFEETDRESGQITQSMLKIKGASVDLTRKGHVRTQMTFEKDKKHTFSYVTAFGEILMTTETEVLTVLTSEKQMTIQIEYKSGMDGKYIADNKLNIVIRSDDALFN